MRAVRPDVLTRWLRSLAGGAGDDLDPDADLLRRFVAGRDESAFLELLRRHGPMVLGVCRRLLADPHAAEDAFQATFLVLLRKGPTLARRELLANWLYGVACRVALRARRSRRGAGLPAAEGLPGDEPDPAEAAARRDLERLLDEEVRRLPDNYRRAVVLCYLQGYSYSEAARQLGRPPGTVATWLARARERLRGRLVRRGLGVPATGLAGLLAADRLSAAVPPALVEQSLAAARSILAGQAAAVSPTVLTLARGVSRTMLRTRLGFVALLLVSLAAGGAFVLSSSAFSDKGVPPQEAAGPGDKPRAEDRPPADKGSKSEAESATPLKLTGFSVISLTGAGRVTVKQTGKEAVSVKGDKALAEKSIAKVEKDTLVLVGASSDPFGAGGKKEAAGVVEFVVEVKELRGLILTGAGSMDVKQLKTKELTVNVSGSGDLSLAGKADALQVTVTGAGNVLAGELTTGRTTIQHLGNGKAVVNATKQLEVSIIGNGSVEYLGSPQVRKSVLGLGSVTKKR
jgi:RNA polymerase sigma factor (sigma-70 family)